ncbi:post-GPI attachment to proteins factor 4-like isoform X2 [Haliotis rubra]|nr:post-GPI attachment to proteins factor 4-like isoform X2 [Haliotis rubra]XP_046572589.1 post-GPI attachment to proteins factor 4-like isoform X2 [Haliotis rubra]
MLWCSCCTKCVEGVPKQIFLLYALTFLVFLPLICVNLRHSLYHLRLHDAEEEERRLITENDLRLVENEQIVKKYNESVIKNSQSGPLLHSEDVDVGITVITVSRNRHRKGGYKPKYLTQVVGRLLGLLNNTANHSKRKYGLFVCNVDDHPETYDELKPLKIILPTFQMYQKTRDSKIDIFEKEKRDYIFCLEETLKLNALYAFLVEDDGYPHKDLIPVLERTIDSHVEQKAVAEFSPKVLPRNVTYVKFYHPERLLGYISTELERLPELFAVSFVFGTLMVILYAHFVLQWTRNNLKVIWFVCVLYCGLVALFVGRVNLMEMRRMSVQTYQVTSAPSCCTPAMLYPRQGGREIVKRLSAVTCKRRYGKDMALEDIRRRHGYTALMVQPNLFKHIGLYSSLRKGVIDPFII